LAGWQVLFCLLILRAKSNVVSSYITGDPDILFSSEKATGISKTCHTANPHATAR
jgi:hypothetical protein